MASHSTSKLAHLDATLYSGVILHKIVEAGHLAVSVVRVDHIGDHEGSENLNM